MGMTKTQYLLLQANMTALLKNLKERNLDAMLELVQPSGQTFEFYAIQKQEASKVRQIVNTDMRTYILYTLVYAIFKSALRRDCELEQMMFPLHSTRRRMIWEDQIMDQGSWSMPLDQSKFDYTIEHWIIVQFTMQMLQDAGFTVCRNLVSQLVQAHYMNFGG